MGRTFKQKPLEPQELPEKYRHLFDYKDQDVHVNPRTGHRDLRVMIACIDCGKKRKVMGSACRKNIANNCFNGRCKSCAAKHRTTLPTANNPKRRYGKDHPAWKGDARKLSNQGYVIRYELGRNEHTKHAGSRNYVLEHRYVMEQHLGRRLSKAETVHHKNGVRTDNRLENLELFGTAHGAGQRYSDLSLDDLDKLIHSLQAIRANLANKHKNDNQNT